MLAKLKEQILNLDSVISANISENQQGEIAEIHIIADKTRNPKNLVRDIETLVQVNLNKEIDHKKISIAQLNLETDSESGVSNQRIEIVSITKFYRQPVCEVHLKLGGMDFKERYRGQSHETTTHLVARAMIKTLESVLPGEIRLDVKNLFFTGLNNEILIIELFWITVERTRLEDQLVKREALIGTAYLREDLVMAAGQAVLNAINRKVQIAFV